MNRTVVAIGGGGFLYGDRFRALDDYVLEVTGRDNPRICFLPTPCGDHPDFIEKFYEAFGIALRFEGKNLVEAVSCLDGRRVRRLETRGTGAVAESELAIREVKRSDHG